MANWIPPSVKSMEKLPTIEVIGENTIQVYLDWFNENKTIPRTIPPLYRDFVIRFSRTYPNKTPGLPPVPHQYIECVHYAEDLASLEVCHVIDGKKVINVQSEYVQYDGPTVYAKASAPGSSPYDESWLKNEGMAVIYSVLAVQAYILYHRPEVVPVYLDSVPEKKAKKSSLDGGGKEKKKVISVTVRKFIRLSVEDKPPKERNYRAIQWAVRGHYRRLSHKDGTEYMVYIRPHLAARNGTATQMERHADIVLKKESMSGK